MNAIPYKNQVLFFIYFSLSGIITWWFVISAPFYVSREQQLLSTGIAGAKWAIQLVAAFLLLGKQRWLFIQKIGFTCFMGSCILIPYIMLSQSGICTDAQLFTGSLVAAVVAMIYYYYKAVTQSSVPLKWWFAWLLCLAIAILLQLTIVFHLI